MNWHSPHASHCDITTTWAAGHGALSLLVTCISVHEMRDAHVAVSPRTAHSFWHPLRVVVVVVIVVTVAVAVIEVSVVVVSVWVEVSVAVCVEVEETVDVDVAVTVLVSV